MADTSVSRRKPASRVRASARTNQGIRHPDPVRPAADPPRRFETGAAGSRSAWDADRARPSAGRACKRALDIFGAAAGLVLLGPLFLLVAAAIVATSGWPVLYRQERVGQHGRRFTLYKFRSMRRDAETETGPIWAYADDARCTRVGAWLRRYNLDELPQLWNVFVGDMSLVGPRPERPVFVDQFTGKYPAYPARHRVPAGMTGWAQIHGWRGRTSIETRLAFDLDYARRWTFALDLIVLARTVQHVVWGKTAWGDAEPVPAPAPTPASKLA